MSPVVHKDELLVHTSTLHNLAILLFLSFFVLHLYLKIYKMVLEIFLGSKLHEDGNDAPRI